MSLKWLDTGAQLISRIVELGSQLVFFFSPFKKIEVSFPGGSVVKKKTSNQHASAEAAGYTDSIPRSGRAPGGGNGNPFQYSCLGNPRTEEPGGPRVLGSQIAEQD